MKKVVEAKNLHISYKTQEGLKEVVKDVSFSLHENEMLAMVGGSGCGKTTICKALLGLLSGRAIVDGILEHGEGHNIAMIFQDPYLSLDPTMPIGKQIEETVLIHIDSHCMGNRHDKKNFVREKALELLTMVGIDNPNERYNQIPLNFSGGMRQRIAIAIALAMEPDVIIADELTSSLDEENKGQILDLLDALRKRLGTAVLLVTHDLGIAENHCDRILVMKDGSIVEEGNAEKIFSNPEADYTKDLLRYANYSKGTEHTHGHFHNDFHLIEIHNIYKSYEAERGQRLDVLEDVSFNIHKGELLGLSGKSGVGKTTLAKCIIGLEKPDKGCVKYVGGLDEDNKMHMIFQDSKSSLNPRMTVRQLLDEARQLSKANVHKKEDVKSIEQLLHMVELTDNLLNKRPYEISGGQRQRVAIARALAMNPQFLIADEPISSLDMKVQAQIIHLLKKIRDENDLSILIISHDMPMLEHVSDRIISL